MGKFWKWPTFSVSIGVENPEKMCAWKTLWILFCSLFLPLLKMVLLFKLTLIELQDFWLHLKPPFFLSYLQKSLDFPTKIVDKKKKDFRSMRKINGKLLQLHWCIINRKLKNVQLNLLHLKNWWKKRFHARFSFSRGPDWSDLFFQLLFKHI